MPQDHSASRIATLLTALLIPGTQALADSVQVDINTKTTYDSNIGNAYGKNSLFDYGQSANIILSSPIFPLNSYSGVGLSGNLQYDQNVRFQGMSHASMGIETNYRIQPFRGFTQPWLDIRSGVTVLQYVDSAIRDGGIFTLTGRVGKQFTDRIQASIGGGLDIRRSESEDVFDYRRNKLLFSLEYRAMEDVTVYADIQRMWGDVVTTVAIPSELLATSNTHAFDSALSSDMARVAYRVGASTDTAELNVTLPIAGEHLVDLGIAALASHTATGDNYYSTQIHAGYTYHFQ